MQRAKHADRKRRTRTLILIGAAAERAGATHLDPKELETVLTHYVTTGGEPKLKAFVAKNRSEDVLHRESGSAATRPSRSAPDAETARSEVVR
ncbi:MAG: hypothetical protein P1U83_11440 [Roseovarius sp.]|nr:hypothetical protein [Roseovarius sp.]